MHNNLKQFDSALTAINKSIQNDPNMAKAYRTRAEVYKAMKKYDKAKADYENAITLQTDNKIKVDMYVDRSIMARDLLDYKGYYDDLNKALELDPKSGMVCWHRSLAQGYRKKLPEAIKDCNSALELYKSDSSSTASLYWLRASHKDKAGDFKGAAEDYQTYLKYYPESYGCYYELGRLYKVKIKNNDLAEANLSKAGDLALKNKDTVKYYYIKLIKGDKDEAIRKMLEVVEVCKNDKEYYKDELHNMCCLYSLAGNSAKAFEYLDKSMAAGYNNYYHLVNDKDLESLMKLPQWKSILTKYKVPVPKF